MREGMKGKAGIGKLALYGREYLVAVQPREKGLVMYTHAAREGSPQHGQHRRARDSVPSKVKPDEIKLAKQVIGNFEGELNLSEYRDEYQEELQRIIDAKIAGEEVVATAEETPPKVVNLMDALRQSLDRVSTGKKKAAKAEIEKPAKAVPRRPSRRSARALTLSSARDTARRSVRGPTAATIPARSVIFSRPGPWPPWMSMRQCPGSLSGTIVNTTPNTPSSFSVARAMRSTSCWSTSSSTI